MDPRRALLLQVEWGADEALLPEPQRHLRAAASKADVAVPPRPPGRATAAVPADLAEFATMLAAHDGAGLAATATNLVLPAGPAGSGLIVVGEAPGAAEDRAGEAFVGPEGQLLRRMLASIDVDPTTTMLTYLTPWRPPGGRAPTESELAVCLPLLHRLLALVRPRLLLALGSVASRALLGPATRRGRWGEVVVASVEAPLAVLPTVNPAVMLKHPQQKAAAWADLRLLRRRIEQ